VTEAELSRGRIPARRPPVAWTGADLLAVLGVGFVWLMVVSAVVEATDFGVATVAENSVVVIAMYAGFAAAGWYFAIHRRKATLSDAWVRSVPITAWAAAVPWTVATIFLSGIAAVLTERFVELPDTRDLLLPGGSTDNPNDIYWVLLDAAIVAPIVEEFLCRGLLYRFLRARRGLWASAAISAAVFALVHFDPAVMPGIFVIGFMLAVIAERNESIVPTILVHGLFNATSVVLVFSAL
jgi:membrane protease YdiL (CAAX protease family)